MKSDENKHGYLLKKTANSGPGFVLQAIGVVIVIVGGPLGYWEMIPATAVGLMLILLGSLVSVKYVCSECGNRIEEKTASICPTCRSSIAGVRSPENQRNMALAVVFTLIIAALAFIIMKDRLEL